jgi:hypothetical protein
MAARLQATMAYLSAWAFCSLQDMKEGVIPFIFVLGAKAKADISWCPGS